MIGYKLKTRGQRPIGLDIGHNSIKMIQLVVDGGHIKILAADKVYIDPNINGDAEQRKSFVVSAVGQILAEGNFHGRNVVSCLPNEKLKITSLRLDETEPEQIRQVLKKEAAQRFGLDSDNDAFDYMLAGSVSQGDETKNEVILFAVDNETIRNHIEMLEQSQLKPVAIDTVPCALFRSFDRSLRRQEDRENTAVFVDLGYQFTTVVFGRGGQISFIKQIPIGGENFNRQIAAKLGVTASEAHALRDGLRTENSREVQDDLCANEQDVNKQNDQAIASQPQRKEISLDASTRQVMIDAISTVAEELAREISLCFRYYTVTFRGKRVEQAFFAGGEAYENILLNVLGRHLAVEIKVAQPLKGLDLSSEKINFDSDRRGLLCEWAVAVGLGLKGWNPETVAANKNGDL
jgi:type IV pilus assembly protein PilM